MDTDLTVLRLEDAQDGAGAGRGLLSWFAVHCTSLNNTNRLVSGDNKGAAQIALEAWAAAAADGGRGGGGAGAALAAAYGAVGFEPRAEVLRLKPGEAGGSGGGVGAGGAAGGAAWEEAAAAARLRFAKGFVAAVAQASVGDTSPNTMGAFCLDTGGLTHVALGVLGLIHVVAGT